MPSLQYLQGCAFALLSFADVRREHGSSLSLAVQLHWIREQEVLCPLPSLRVAWLPRYDAVLVRHHHGVLSLLCHDIQTALRRSVVAPLRLHRSVLMASRCVSSSSADSTSGWCFTTKRPSSPRPASGNCCRALPDDCARAFPIARTGAA